MPQRHGLAALLTVLLLALVPGFAHGQATCIYFEDFKDGPGNWTAVDLTAAPTHWQHLASWGGAIGVAWCGTDDPALATPPGYGDRWGDWIEKSFDLPFGDWVSYQVQYDLEPGFDFLYVSVSVDGGDFETVASHTGVSSGFESGNFICPPGYVTIRFTVISDGSWSDEDGLYDSDGACRLDVVQVGETRYYDFTSDLDGWTPGSGIGGGSYRLEATAPCQEAWPCPNLCDSWTAADPLTGLFPTHPGMEIGIESPVVSLPAGWQEWTACYLEFDYHMAQPHVEGVFFDYYVTSPPVPQGGNWITDGYIHYSSRGSGHVRFNIRPYLTAGSLQIRLSGLDYPGTQYSEPHTGPGPIFDNVSLIVEGTVEPGYDYSGYPRACPGYESYPTPSGTDVVVDAGPAADLTFDNVTQAGNTYLTEQDSGIDPPAGFEILSDAGVPIYYDITTSALFTGAVEVCLTYDPATLPGSEAKLRLFHYSMSVSPPAWQDVTTSLDIVENRICGSVTSLSPFIIASPTGVNQVYADASTVCISTAHPCVTVPVVFDRDDVDPARAATVTIELSPELALCGSGITQGNWLDGYATIFEVIEEGGGVYTVDQAILGEPCGVTTGGTLFNLEIQASASADPDDAGTITVTNVEVRDCGNPFSVLAGEPGPAANVPIDRTAPAAVTDLASLQVKSGNDTDGTTGITVTFTAPVDADRLEVYRKGFGDYPEYDDLAGAEPSIPSDPTAAVAAGWALTTVATSGGEDEVLAPRDVWYYVLFSWDECDNLSAVSNRAGGTLNYHLGDVTDGETPGTGDNLVDLADGSALGDAYGTSEGGTYYQSFIDIGPTTDNSTNGRPTTDNKIQFEDLIILAINYGGVSKPMPALPGAERNAVALDVAPGADGIEAVVTLSSTGAVQGVSLPLVWNAEAVEPIAVRSGELVNRQSGRALVLSPEPGTVDAAVFGSTFSGEGELATVTFRVIGSGDPGIRFGEVIARDGENRPVQMGTTVESRDLPVTPTVTRLLPSAPNPFLSSTQIRFALAEPGEATVRVYGMDGRLVRTLIDAALPAGEKSVMWDGRDEMGRAVAAGTYIVQFRAANVTEAQRVMRLR